MSLRSQVIILDEPTAAFVSESAKVLNLIQDLRGRGISVILIFTTCPRCSRWRIVFTFSASVTALRS